MTDIQTIIDSIRDTVHELVHNKFEQVDAADLGLDPRCGKLFIENESEIIACKKDRAGSLDYYGGFEYIERDYIETFGDYVFYSVEHSECRVANCFEHYNADK